MPCRPQIRFGMEWWQSTPPRAGRRTICRFLRPRVQRHAEIVRGELAWLNHPLGGRTQIRFDPGPAELVLRRLQDDLTRLERALRQASAPSRRRLGLPPAAASGASGAAGTWGRGDGLSGAPASAAAPATGTVIRSSDSLVSPGRK